MRKTSPLFHRICVIAFCLAALSACRERAPEILAIYPSIGQMGEPLTIIGRGFGETRNESYITIAGAPPTSAAYISWSNEEIVVRVPEFGTPGLVRVHRGRSVSNPVLFSNQTTLPQRMRGDEEDGVNPRITSITPAAAAVGALVTIHGNNFGLSRENSTVLFSWNSGTLSPGSLPSGLVEVSALEFGYEFWSDREIRVRVPSGAVSGNIEVQTLRGNSRPAFFEVSGQPGTKVFRDRRSYVFSYMVDVRVEQASSPNSLHLWMPKPALSSSQRDVRIVDRNIEPFIENHRGTSLFHFTDLNPQTSVRITVSYVVDVYAVETNITNQNPVNLNPPSPVRAAYTAPSALVPSDHAGIQALAAQITGTDRRPYAMARRIYDWMLASVEFQSAQHAPLSGGAIEAMEELAADSYRAAMLFSALARASGIPAIPVSGILVNEQQSAFRHYWVEFWLEGFGWIPVDPALGAGAAPALFNLRGDHAGFYFGNMDNQRVAFSRGEHLLTQMAANSRIVHRPREFSLQNLWEEASGGIEFHSSIWSDVIITGVF